MQQLKKKKKLNTHFANVRKFYSFNTFIPSEILFSVYEIIGNLTFFFRDAVEKENDP